MYDPRVENMVSSRVSLTKVWVREDLKLCPAASRILKKRTEVRLVGNSLDGCDEPNRCIGAQIANLSGRQFIRKLMRS